MNNATCFINIFCKDHLSVWIMSVERVGVHISPKLCWYWFIVFTTLVHVSCVYRLPTVDLTCVTLIISETNHSVCLPFSVCASQGAHLQLRAFNHSDKFEYWSYIFPEPPHVFWHICPLCIIFSIPLLSFHIHVTVFHSERSHVSMFELISPFSSHFLTTTYLNKTVLFFFLVLLVQGGLGEGLFIGWVCVLWEILITTGIWTQPAFGCALGNVDGSVLPFIHTVIPAFQKWTFFF